MGGAARPSGWQRTALRHSRQCNLRSRRMCRMGVARGPQGGGEVVITSLGCVVGGPLTLVAALCSCHWERRERLFLQGRFRALAFQAGLFSLHVSALMFRLGTG